MTENQVNCTQSLSFKDFVCKDRRILAGNPSDRPADGSDGWHLCEDPPGVPALHPTPPGRGSSPYKQPELRRRALYYRPLSRREPGESPREQMLTSLPGNSSIRSSKPPWSTRPRDDACATLSLYPFLVVVILAIFMAR